jgi:hypothetical protein
MLEAYLTQYEDDLWSFFQNCWHLKDWIKNDDTLDAKIRTKIVDEAHASPALMVCADLANASKHLKLDPKYRKNKQYPNARNEELHVVIDTDASVSLDFMIAQDRAPIMGARDAASMALTEWERILTVNGVPLGVQ